LSRVREAEVLIVNKTQISAETIAQMPHLRYIGVLATGYNNVDVKAAAARCIPVCNAVGYGSKSVAQHVFALILELTNRVGDHAAAVRAGDWARQPHFSFSLSPTIELAGKTLGLYGLGGIGREVARIGQAFGMKIIVVKKNREGVKMPRGMRLVDLDELFAASDFLSLNAPLSVDNQGLINLDSLKNMKPTAFLINTARGGLVVEDDLKAALETGIIAGAGLDVLTVEPPQNTEGGLLGLKNCLITPHNAWASTEARQRLMHIAVNNLAAFQKGKPQNVVNLSF
jgi:glycerate dehydrogenase